MQLSVWLGTRLSAVADRIAARSTLLSSVGEVCMTRAEAFFICVTDIFINK